ncbi:MAG: TIGR00366 family protein [Planctomycetota bacterium]
MQANRFPHSLVLIFGMIVVAQLATYVLPAGEYARETSPNGRERVVPGTYAPVEAERLPPYAALALIPQGLERGGEIIFFVFLVGGVIGVIRSTGAIDAMIQQAIHRFGETPGLLIAGMMGLFALGSSTIGMAEEYMPFIPILVTMCLAMKMDALVAMAVVYVGAGIGYGCAFMNPFTVLIAQEIAGLPPVSGASFRFGLLVICLLVGIHHLLRYAHRIQKDPKLSLVADIDYSQGFEMPEDTRLTGRRIAILLAFVAGIVWFVVGVTYWEWYLTELATILLFLALFSAIVAGLSPNRVAESFCKGAAELTTTALLIGFARTIEVVLNEGRVIDTVIHGIAQPLQQTGPAITAVGMLAVQSICNLFIPSGSGQAYVTMPIMAPLADLTGLTRQTSVLAYQIGDGFTNMIVPTNALLMGMLGLGRIPYQRWFRFIVPLMIKLFVVASLAMIVAVNIKYT